VSALEYIYRMVLLKTWLDRWVLLAGISFLLVGGGCLKIPGDYRTIGPHAELEAPLLPVDSCHPGVLSHENISNPVPVATLDGDGFTLASWNFQKGRQPGWPVDLNQLIGYADIVLLQEARLSVELSRVLAQKSQRWDLAPAFIYRDDPIGVLTAAQATPLNRCIVRTREPLLQVPKSMLMTRYAFNGGVSSLVVVNLHGINFTLGTASYRNLWQILTTVLTPHSGPLIVAGDFNTWSDMRLAIVEDALTPLGMASIKFPKGKRSMFRGHAVDHVYYRGLTPLTITVPQVESSDHHPLLVRFKLT